jgi:uncharacterized protein
MHTELISKTAEHMQSLFQQDTSGHDWWHIYRVWQNAKLIAASEPGINLEVIELGALLHDIADFKFHDGDEKMGGKVAREWLASQGADADLIDQVCHIVDNVSFKGAQVASQMQSVEGKIVQDADRLDAMGAIGIARCFAFGGAKGRLLFDPTEVVEMHNSFDKYKNKSTSSLNHFYEKLLLLKDLMNTETGKRVALERHKIMENFVAQFKAEWEGTK